MPKSKSYLFAMIYFFLLANVQASQHLFVSPIWSVVSSSTDVINPEPISFFTDSNQVDSPPKYFVNFNDQLRIYAQAPRLSLLLFQAGNGWYWPTARLYKINSASTHRLEIMRQDVMEQLRLLALHWYLKPDIAQQFMALRHHIQNWQMGDPLNVVLDPDAFVVMPQLDKALDEGHYVLKVNKRMNYLTFVGLGGEQKINHQGDLAAYAYLDQLPMSGWRDSDEVWLVQTKASLQQPEPRSPQAIPVANWNKSDRSLPIGALLFVPIPAKYLPEPWQHLNEQLLNLMEHRIFP